MVVVKGACMSLPFFSGGFLPFVRLLLLLQGFSADEMMPSSRSWKYFWDDARTRPGKDRDLPRRTLYIGHQLESRFTSHVSSRSAPRAPPTMCVCS